MLFKEGISYPSLFKDIARFGFCSELGEKRKHKKTNTNMYSSFVRFVKSISRNCDIRLFWKNLVTQVKTQLVLNITWDYVYTLLY